MPKLIDLNDQWFANGEPLNVHRGIYAPYDVTFASWVVPMGTVGMANTQSLKLLAPELLSGGKGMAYGVFDGELELSQGSFDALIRALNGLCSYPLIDDDMLVRVENRQRYDWWNEYGNARAVNAAIWNGAYDVYPDLKNDDDRVLEVGTFLAFVNWAKSQGFDVYEYESWTKSGSYGVDVSWVEDASRKMHTMFRDTGADAAIFAKAFMV